MRGRRHLILAGLLAVASAGAWGQSFTIVPSSLPIGGGVFVLGKAIPLQQLSITPPLDASFTWSVSSGSLPPGLVLDPAAASIMGTPTQAGAFTFTVMAVENGAPAPEQAFQQYTLYVSTGAPLTLTPVAHLSAATGSFYFGLLFQASGGVPGYTWALQSGINSDGLTLDPSLGSVTGIPQAGGIFPIGAVVTDASGVQASSSNNLNVLGINTASLPNDAIGIAYSQNLAAVGNTGLLSWSLLAGSLPPGLSLSPQGQITGTPTQTGPFTFQVGATDPATSLTAAQSLSITITATLAVSTASLPSGTIGLNYSQTLQATGGTPPYTWTATGLPAGLTLAPTTGILSGIPTATGASTISVTLNDAVGGRVTLALTLTIGGLGITPAALPSGFVNVPYSSTLTVAGTTVANWAITAGALPAGLNLNPSTGVISGTPTAAGSSPFTITASFGIVTGVVPPIVQSFTIVINAVTITGLPSTGVAGTQPSATVSLSGGTYPYTISGTLDLAFAPASGGSQLYDAKFANGTGTTAPFTITPPATAATVPVMIGTVAGRITITTTNLIDSNGNTLQLPAPTVITVNPTPPVITKVTIGTVTASGFSISVTGYSTPRDMTSALFHFTSPTGTQLASADVTVPLTSAFTSWYGSPASNPFGSQFTVTVQFTFTGPPGTTVPFTTVTVTMTNSIGTSTVFGPISP